MSRVEREIEIARPPEAVYDAVMDPDRLGEWVSIHRRLKEVSDRPLAEGSTLRQTLRLAHKNFDVRWTVVEAARPERVRWEGRGPAGSRATVEYGFEQVDGATRFNYANEFHAPGGPLGRVAERALGGTTEREAERTLEALKRYLES